MGGGILHRHHCDDAQAGVEEDGRKPQRFALAAAEGIGGGEFLLYAFKVPHYVLPRPSQIVTALYTEFPFYWPHLLTTLFEMFVGFAIGGAIGFVLAAVITQFPFVEKIVTPYILLLVTTPMLALVPLLILRFGFGSEPRIIAVLRGQTGIDFTHYKATSVLRRIDRRMRMGDVATLADYARLVEASPRERTFAPSRRALAA